jgi:signal transduction protein with GAF and PtsI domain
MNVFDRESVGWRAIFRPSIVFQGRPAPALSEPNHLAKEVNFFSICTNDSIPYTLVVVRKYETVAGLGCTALPIVLRSTATVVQAAPRQRWKSVFATRRVESFLTQCSV